MTDTVKNKKDIPATCVRCGETSTITVVPSDVIAWKEGALIQDVLPYLTANERELLISGTCGTCFDTMFKDWD